MCTCCFTYGTRVLAALERARSRGVRCRILADAVASRRFLRRVGPQLIRQGIQVVPVLPVNPLRRFLARFDLRNHRKLAVVDGQVAYAGSQNIVRPDYHYKGVGDYRDLMVRVVGPSVSQLQAVFLEDWEFESGESIDEPDYFPPPRIHGAAALQVVPSGPNHPTRILRDLAIEGLHAARNRVGIITPYFVPDEALLVALRLAVVRGARVDLIVPACRDQLWVGLAAEFVFGELLEHGVHIHLHQHGMLHVKAMIVDDDFAMLGSANFDIRSFYLNFELNLLSYDPYLNGLLRTYQANCIEQSRELDLSTWQRRGSLKQWGAQVAKLLSPLL